MAFDTLLDELVTAYNCGSTMAEIASLTEDSANVTAAKAATDDAAAAKKAVPCQTFMLTTGLDTRSGSFSIDSFSFLNTLAAASLASGHRSAPRFS